MSWNPSTNFRESYPRARWVSAVSVVLAGVRRAFAIVDVPAVANAHTLWARLDQQISLYARIEAAAAIVNRLVRWRKRLHRDCGTF